MIDSYKTNSFEILILKFHIKKYNDNKCPKNYNDNSCLNFIMTCILYFLMI